MAGFIGPEGSNCATEAMVAGSKNKAMISYRCSDAEITSQEKFPTFTRMEPPDTQVRNSNTGSKIKTLIFEFLFLGHKFSFVSIKILQMVQIFNYISR